MIENISIIVIYFEEKMSKRRKRLITLIYVHTYVQ